MAHGLQYEMMSFRPNTGGGQTLGVIRGVIFLLGNELGDRFVVEMDEGSAQIAGLALQLHNFMNRMAGIIMRLSAA